MSLRTIIALFFSLVALTLALQNTESVDIHLLMWDFPMKVGFAVGVPFILGMFVGLLLSWRQQRKVQKAQQIPEPGSPAALLANVDAPTEKKKAAGWWW